MNVTSKPSRFGNRPHIRIYMGNDGRYTWKNMPGHGFGAGLVKWREQRDATYYCIERNAKRDFDRKEKERKDAAFLELLSDGMLEQIANAAGVPIDWLKNLAPPSISPEMAQAIDEQYMAIREGVPGGKRMCPLPEDFEYVTGTHVIKD